MKASIVNIIIFCLSVLVNLNAQDSTRNVRNYQLDEITIESDKLNSKLADVPTKIEVVTQKEIAALNGDRLPDILKTKSSIFLKSYGLTPALNTISINGLGAEHTLIIVDGVKLNSFQNSHIDLSLIPKNTIERIEILNNGVSSIYGSDAIGGVVNIILKSKEILPQNRTTKYKASLTQGSFNTVGYSLNLYKEIDKFNFSLNFNKESSDGNFEYYYDNGIEKILKRRENSAYELYDLAFRTQYLFNENNIFKFLSTYSNQDKEVPGIETGITPAQTNQLDKIWNNILTIDNNLSGDLSLRTNFNFQNNFTDYSVGDFLRNTYKNLVYSGNSEVRFKKANYGITSGYNFTHATLESGEVIHGIKRNQHALFISSFLDFDNIVKLYPSIRYDYISDISEQNLTYRIGFNLQPVSERHFGLRGNIGKNFRAPSFNDLYWKNSGNKNLKSETSLNMEGGLFFGFTGIIKGKIEVDYTYIFAENKIVWIPQSTGYWAPFNIAESKSNNYAVSLNLSKAFSESISIDLSSGAQFTNTKKTSSSYLNDPTKNKYIPYIPLQAIKISMGINYDFWELNIFYSHNGKRYSDYENKNSMNSYNSVDMNIGATFKVYDFVNKLQLEINNITNTEYEIISGYPMPLRYYKLTFSIKY